MKLSFRKLGEGQPLFILHGLFGLSDNWASVGKILSQRAEVYLIDLRNHGSSPHSEEWTYAAMANDIKELMAEVKGQMTDGDSQKFVLLGHSLGGKVAMQFASMYPEMLQKLIVADMAPKDYPGKQFDFIEKLLTVNLAEMKTRKEAETALYEIVKDWATVQLLLKNIQWNDEQKLIWKFNLKVIAENQDKIGSTFHIGKNMTTPTLFIRGERSNYILDSDIPKIKDHFPNSQIKTIAGAGHWVHADKPGDFADAVQNFMEESPNS